VSRHALDETHRPPEELPAAYARSEDNGVAGSAPAVGEAAEVDSEPTVLFEQVLEGLTKLDTSTPPQRMSEFHDWWVPVVEPEPLDVDEAQNSNGGR
jgi:hypothetical protein